MKMFVVRAGDIRAGQESFRQFNRDHKISSVAFTVKLNLKNTHDLETVMQALEKNRRTLEANDENVLGHATNSPRKRASELLIFAHDIKKGDLIFTPDSRREFRDILVGKVVEPYLYWLSKHNADLLSDNGYPIRHILEEVEWHEITLPRKEMPETICSAGHAKSGVDLRGTVFEIKNPECRRDLLEEMRKRNIEF